jgi:flavocytochrome c
VPDDRYDVDVIVIGSGAAGMCAALEAEAAGMTVLLAEAEGILGGSSRLSGGIMFGAGTPTQKAKGIEDSVDEAYHDYMSLNQWRVESAAVHRLITEAGPSIQWLKDLGVEFSDELVPSGDELKPRCHIPTGAGDGVIGTLVAGAKRRPGIDIALGRRVDRLLIEDGRVVGAAVGDDVITAQAVIVTTGGFGNNPELLAQHYPDATTAGDWGWYIGAPGARGDALSFADQVGAQVLGENRGLMVLRPNFTRNLEVYFPGWIVMVNGHGQRFFDETAPYSVTEPLVRAQPGPIWAIFDDHAKRMSNPKNVSAGKKLELPDVVSDWVEDIIDAKLEEGIVLRADTVEELAELIGVPRDNLVGTLQEYNKGIDVGEDRFYRKDPALAGPVRTAPFYATELRLCQLCLTSTGMRIDPDARVIGQDSRVIPGLYAAGECTGGILGDIYVGSGNSYTNCVVFGRIAGRSAAADVLAAREQQGAPA